MINQTKTQVTIQELFLKLDKAGLINANQILPRNFKKIIARMQDTNNMLKSFQQIFENNQQQQFESANKPWFTGLELDLIHSNLMIFFMLESMESTKEILKIVLNQNVSYNGEILKDTNTLGDLLDKFSKMFNEPKYSSLLNNTLRKALAHSHYWWENDKFAYIKNGKDEFLTYSDFVDEYNAHDEITLAILKECKDRGFLN